MAGAVIQTGGLRGRGFTGHTRKSRVANASAICANTVPRAVVVTCLGEHCLRTAHIGPALGAQAPPVPADSMTRATVGALRAVGTVVAGVSLHTCALAGLADSAAGAVVQAGRGLGCDAQRAVGSAVTLCAKAHAVSADAVLGAGVGARSLSVAVGAAPAKRAFAQSVVANTMSIAVVRARGHRCRVAAILASVRRVALASAICSANTMACTGHLATRASVVCGTIITRESSNTFATSRTADTVATTV